jgi:hypothetical protein
MCTVTIFIKNNNDFVLTTNRDEAPERVSLVPDFYQINHAKLLFPKDVKGGTWIGISEKNRVVCVLNGAFKPHERQATYRKSRGVVANDFMIANNVVSTIETYNLEEIEPFTMVIPDWNETLKIYELVWDGKQKHLVELPLEPRIWSSSTLYSNGMQKERQQWFEHFIEFNTLSARSLLEFHKTEDSNNLDYGIIMNRGFVKTTSITQIEKIGNQLKMRYENLEQNKVTTKTFKVSQIVNG